MLDIRGQVALVTGAAVGIGAAIARDLAGRGAAVMLVDRDPDGAATADAMVADGGSAAFERVDLTDDDQVRAAIHATVQHFGGLDILVNNAGGTEPPYFPNADPTHWTKTLDLNLRTPMVAIHHAVPAMRLRGGGAIVNIGSVGGVGFKPYDLAEYGAAKAGLMRLTASLGTLAADNIRVTCICPGSVDTPAMARTRAAMSPEDRERSLRAPILTPEQIAHRVADLITDDTLAGRVMIWHEGEEPFLVPVDAPY